MAEQQPPKSPNGKLIDEDDVSEAETVEFHDSVPVDPIPGPPKPLLRPFRELTPTQAKAIYHGTTGKGMSIRYMHQELGYQLRWRCRKFKPATKSKQPPYQAFLDWYDPASMKWVGRSIKPSGPGYMKIPVTVLPLDNVNLTPADTGGFVDIAKGSGDYRFVVTYAVPGSVHYDGSLNGEALKDLIYLIKACNDDLVYFLAHGIVEESTKPVGSVIMSDIWESPEVDGKPDAMYKVLKREHASENSTLLRQFGALDAGGNITAAPRFSARAIGRNFGDCTPSTGVPIGTQRYFQEWRDWFPAHPGEAENEVHLENMKQRIIASRVGTSDHLYYNPLPVYIDSKPVSLPVACDQPLEGATALATISLGALKVTEISGAEQFTMGATLDALTLIMSGRNLATATGANVSAASIFDAIDAGDDTTLASYVSETPPAPAATPAAEASIFTKRSAPPSTSSGSSKKRAKASA